MLLSEKNRILKIVFALVFVFSTSACNLKSSSSDKIYQKASKLISDGKFEEAIDICTEELKTSSSKYKWYGLRASAEIGTKDFKSSYDDFKKAIAENRNVVWYYADLGYVCVLMHKNKEAVENCTTVIEKSKSDKDTEVAYDTRALAYRNLCKFDEAIQDISEAIKINPKNAGLYSHRAYVYNDLYEIDKALEDANKAIEMDSNSSFSYRTRADIYLNKREFQKALKDIQKCLNIDEKDFGAHEQLTFYYDETDKPEKALEIANKLIELYPKKANAYGNRALLYIDHGEIDKAESDIQKAFSLLPDSAYGLACISTIYAIKGEGEKAIALKPKLEAINLLKAKSYLCLGYISLRQYDEVIDLAQEMISLAPKRAAAYRYLSEVYRETGKKELAEKNMKKAIELGYSTEQFTESVLKQIKRTQQKQGD